MQPTLELVSFNTKDGIARNTVLKASEAVNIWAKKQPGFSYRTLVSRDDGSWCDLVYWNSEEDAKAASGNFMKAEEVKEFMSVIDPESVKMEHLKILQFARPN